MKPSEKRKRSHPSKYRQRINYLENALCEWHEKIHLRMKTIESDIAANHTSLARLSLPWRETWQVDKKIQHMAFGKDRLQRKERTLTNLKTQNVQMTQELETLKAVSAELMQWLP